MAELGERQRQHARGDARAAARHHRLAQIDAGILEQSFDLAAAI